MNTKQKIISIYAGVAVLSVALIAIFIAIGKSHDKRFPPLPEVVSKDFGKEKASEFLTLEENLIATNQDGEEVSLFDLKEKTWVFAQFFARCPQCGERNYQDLLSLYKKYKDNPNFHLVCITVAPETDTVTKIKEYADALGAETDSWWFLTGDKETMHRYMSKEMKFLDIRERTDEMEIASKGKYAHDLSIAVFAPNLKMVTKRDLFFARSQGEDIVETFSGDIKNAIESNLK